MNIIQIGSAKSGNFWLYKIIQQIMKQAELERKSFIQQQPIYSVAKDWDLSYPEQSGIDVLDIEREGVYYRISSIFRKPITEVDEYLSMTTHVWTHSFFCQRSVEVLSKFNKIVYIIRDPRDRLISAAKFRYTDYGKEYYSPVEPDPESWLRARFGNMIRRWTRHVGNYLLHKSDLDIHFVFFERLLYSFEEEVSGLAHYLGIPLQEQMIREIRNKVEFNQLKHTNTQHLRKGKSGYWIDQFSDQEIFIAAFFAGGLMNLLNYPQNRKSWNQALPYLPERINETIIRKDLRRAYRFDKLKRIQRFLSS